MILFLAALALAPVTPQPAELRGVWIVRTALASPESADAAVDAAARAGLNAVFVQVRGRGDALYRSALAPRSEVLRGQPPEYDPLARVIAQARPRGLAVHAWINVLLVGGFAVPLPPGHVAAAHPDWLMVPRAAARSALAAPAAALPALIEGARDADVEGFYLSPSSAPATAHLEAVAHELVSRYAVDGLHLDFIRYPGRDYDYSRAALAGFRGRRGRGWLLDGPERDPEGFERHRRDAVAAVVARLSAKARRARPGIVVSAAVVPEEAAMRAKGQDWMRWLAGGALDAAIPMAYTPDSGLFAEQIAALRARVGPRAALWAGIGAYRLDAPGVVEKVRAARASGASGVVLFSSDSLDTAGIDLLRREVFAAGDARRGVSAPAAGAR
jgi:uncharacterized lipoprotein YddW (UPF0748 family)